MYPDFDKLRRCRLSQTSSVDYVCSAQKIRSR